MNTYMKGYFDDGHFAFIDFLDDIEQALVYNHVTIEEAIGITKEMVEEFNG